MLDIGFSEIAVVGVVALVVLGPERLPKVARTAGHMFGRLQRYVATVKSDINREMDASEFAKLKEEVTSAAKSFEQTVNEQTSAFNAEAASIENAANIEKSTVLTDEIAKANVAASTDVDR
ncbi:MAG: twin-arginine translocase subunit TatB [Gammaproteobacteria bacterium]|nr:twin-arginine translocase subunit TatB [Gammaproteobacteria bacterium]